MSDDREPCPHCEGDGSYVALACNRRTSRVVTITCPPCGGTGKISPTAADLHRRGKALHARRLEAKEGLLAAARRLGVPAVELGEVERGVAPAALVARVEALWNGDKLAGES